jgi:hypothetical protein
LTDVAQEGISTTTLTQYSSLPFFKLLHILLTNALLKFQAFVIFAFHFCINLFANVNKFKTKGTSPMIFALELENTVLYTFSMNFSNIFNWRNQ